MFDIVVAMAALAPVIAFAALLRRAHRKAPLLGRTPFDCFIPGRSADYWRAAGDLRSDADTRRIATELRALAAHESTETGAGSRQVPARALAGR